MPKTIMISALVHVIVLAVVSVLPVIRNSAEEGLTFYSVELVEVPTEPPATGAETAPVEQQRESVVEESTPEERVEETIPEKPQPPRRKLALKPPSERPDKTLADRIADRLAREDEKRKETTNEKQAPDALPPVSAARVRATRFPYGWYLSIIQGKVSTNWRRPSGALVAQRALSALVSFRIARDGSIHAITVKRSSGRATVDQSAARAIRSSAPFPELPDDYREDHLDVSIEFTVARQ